MNKRWLLAYIKTIMKSLQIMTLNRPTSAEAQLEAVCGHECIKWEYDCDEGECVCAARNMTCVCVGSDEAVRDMSGHGALGASVSFCCNQGLNSSSTLLPQVLLWAKSHSHSISFLYSYCFSWSLVVSSCAPEKLSLGAHAGNAGSILACVPTKHFPVSPLFWLSIIQWQYCFTLKFL